MRRFLPLIVVVLAAHGLLFSGLPLIVRAMAALVIAGVGPGVLLAALLLAGSERLHSPGERLLLAVGASFVAITLGMLLLSYLPGGVLRWQALFFFDALTGLFWLLLWRRPEKPSAHQPEVGETAAYPSGDWRWLLAGVFVLLLVGGFYRFVGLGYAEFHGDEARAILRAVAVVQGHEDALLIHRKGPVEILIPAAIFVLAGQIDEAAARLPFAVAGLAGVLAIFYLGWRVFSGAAAWIAGLLLALNGYFIAFSRFVQYQSVVILTSALALLLLTALVQRPMIATRRLMLAALLFATALLAHYDALAAAPPLLLLAGFLVWMPTGDRRGIARSLGLAGLVGGVALALYYLPFLLHPNFTATLRYLMSERIVGSASPPFDNLGELFMRGALYNSAYQMALLIGLLLIGLALVFWRGYGRVAGALSIAATGVAAALALWRDDWLTGGGVDLTVAPFALLLFLACAAPRLSIERRAMWVWFAVPFIFLVFFTAFPRTHVHVFFAPWALLVGDVVALGWLVVTGRWSPQAQLAAASAATLTAIIVLGGYPYWLYLYNQVEVLRTWREHAPRFYWSPAGVESIDGRFGFPFTNGWKAVGALYEQGVLSGDYETNQRYLWIPTWYTRGAQRCWSTADWYFAVDNLEPWMEDDDAVEDRLEAQGFALWGTVEVNDAERMEIYRNTGTFGAVDAVERFRLEELTPRFDARADANLTLPWPIVSSTPEHRLHMSFGDQIWLEGYTIGQTSAHPGDSIPVTLYWQAQRPLDASYKVSLQSYYGDGVKVAQHDAVPVCDREPTTDWSPGEMIEDVHTLPINPDAPSGVYPLYVTLYHAETGEGLPVLDDTGRPSSGQFQLGEIEVQSR